MSSAKEVASKKKEDSSGWYDFSKNLIDPLMVRRAKILDLVRQGKYSTTQAKIMCKDSKKDLKDVISLAKANWTSHLAERIHEMARNPKDSWKAINTLKEWIQGHHKTPDIMRFAKEDSSFTGTDEEVVDILAHHFHKVYNGNVEIECSVLDDLEQKPVRSDIYPHFII